MKEYGGYLPLELPRKREYFSENKHDFIRLNCGRSAIYCALRDAKPSKVYIPYYNCATVEEPFVRLGIPYSFYKIDRDFLPVDVALKDNEYLLYVNYYGIADSEKISLVLNRYGRVFFDNTQAFFADPVEDAYNIYSCRKFFGVSDGAYLLKRGIKPIELPQDSSCERMLFTMKCIEQTTNDAYREHLENEAVFAKEPMLMSRLTQRILSSVDYPSVRRQRYRNFLCLHKILGGKNLLAVNIESRTPVAYPLLIKNDGLRRRLIEKKVYVPCWWKHVMDKTEPADCEYELSRYLLPLPIDQRYSVGDMEELAEIVLESAVES